MKKIRRKGKAEGSVLFTVVTVMMVMVVFLMSTLVLTTSANRRSYYTFYENQAQYTAQGVLDAILTAANDPDPSNVESANFYHWVQGLSNVGDVGTIDVQLNIDDTSKAFIPLTRHSNGDSAVTATVERIGANYIWDAESASVCEQGGWKITVTASVGQGRNASEYTMASYIYENPVNNVNTGAVNDAAWNVINSFNVTPGSTTIIDPGSGSSNKAKAMYMGGLSNDAASNNLLCLGPQTYGIRRLPAGRGNYANEAVVGFRNNPQTVGDGLFIGNFEANCATSFVAQRPGEGVQFWGNIYAQNMFEFRSEINDSSYPTEYRFIPYLYVDGNLHFNGDTGQEIGMSGTPNDTPQPVNLYVGSMTNIAQHMNGDIYMYDPAASSNLENGRKTTLSTFVRNNVQKTNYTPRGFVGGDVICNNSALTIAGAVSEIGGDVIMTNPDGKLTIRLQNEDLTIRGALLCAGDLEINTGNKSLTVLGGIYSTDSKTTINGRVNGVTSGSLSEICDATKNMEAYLTAQTFVGDDGVERLQYIQNTSTSAHFESLGGRGADGTGYDDLVSKLLSGNLGAQSGSDYYTLTNNSGRDYSMFPFCSRQDEIFTHYFRWDLAADSAEAASANCDNDPLCQESKACGHEWRVTQKASDAATKWVPYTVPKAASAVVESLDPNSVMLNNNNSFIPMLETSQGSPIAANEYINTVGDFTSGANCTAVNIKDIPTKNVTFISHSANGTAVPTTLNSVPVVTSNTDIDLTCNDVDYTIFVDPPQRNSQIRIVLRGRFMNRALNIIVNNNCSYESGGGGADYSKPTTYADSSHSTGNPSFAGRSNVLIFFDSSIYVNKGLNIMTTGAYQQLMKDHTYDIISNPLYPGTMDANGNLVLNGEWDALYPGADAFKFELIPNIVIYGEKDFNYNGSFQNGFVANAEFIAPDSDFGSAISEPNVTSLEYREFTESVKYNPYANTNNKPNSSGIMTMGTMLVRDLKGYTNLPICVYLGDLNRPSRQSTTAPTVTANDNSLGNQGGATAGSRKDRFGKDHQGAR